MNENNLIRQLSVRDIFILAFSTMIGWGWVSLTGIWIVSGGSIGAIIAFLTGAILCIFIGLMYCELTPMLPYAGGELVFSYKAMGYHASYFTGWMITFAYLGIAAWEGPALATAIDYLIQIPRIGYLYTIADFDVYISWLLIPAIEGAFLIYINFRGIKFSTIFQAAVTLILAAGGILFAGVSLIEGNISNMQPFITQSSGVIAVMLSVPAMFVGFDVIPQVVEEMNLPVKKIPKIIILSICLATTWYIIMILSAALAAPANILSVSGLTVVNAMNFAADNVIAGKILIISAIMGILTSWNGFIIGATRVLYSMGRAKMLPEKFSAMHPKYNTPYFATLFVGVITIFTPLFGKNSLTWFVEASSFGTVIAYFMVALSFVVLRIKQPELERPFKIKNGLPVGLAAMAVSIFFISLYLPTGASSLNKIEWLIVASWLIVGMIFYLNNFQNIDRNKIYRDSAMYGKKSDISEGVVIIMGLKKVLVHGDRESLKEFFSVKFTKPQYEVVAILSDDSRNKIVNNNLGGG